MTLLYIEAIKSRELETVVILADQIWHEYFTSIIGSEQVKYMLKKFQSLDSIDQQIKDGYRYFLLMKEHKPIGYIGFKTDNKDLFLSKFYIISDYRNLGLGRQTLAFIEQQAIASKLNKITLTVNKNNTDTIKAYQKMGFVNKGSVIKDIGEGFIMDDFLMEKTIKS